MIINFINKRTANDWIPRIIFFILLSFFANTVYTQSISEIKNSGNYYWGEGVGADLEKADKNALADLIGQISVNIESRFKNIKTEENGNFKEYTELVTNTYSGATLDRAERKVTEGKDQVTVLRYITKEKMDEIFTERKDKIFEYIKSAQKAEADLRIGDALKYYYWALALDRSHPDCNEIKYNLNGSGDLLLLTALPDKINSILSQIQITISDILENKDEKKVILSIKYLDKPVQNYDFIYWTGDTWTSLNTAKDGVGVADFFGETAKSFTDLRLRAEYVYKNNSRIDQEVYNVLDNTNIPSFKMAEVKIPLKIDGKASIEQPAEQTENNKTAEVKTTKTENSVVTDLTPELNEIIDKVTKSIDDKNIVSVKNLFTDDGYANFEKLIGYGNAKNLPQVNPVKIVQLDDKTIIRSLPMEFSFQKSNRKYVENIVLTLNKENKIASVAFALNDKSISDIVSKSPEFASDKEKYLIIEFMENYKTAYNLGRIDYLEQIFADNALIIVGHVLKPDNTKRLDGMYMNIGEQNVNYLKLSKHEYIERLKIVFASNEFINIQFDENTVKKARPDSKIYGIQIAQNYYSTNYADKGYLFLMIDLNDSVNPKIYVRTWQPTKNSDGSIYGITDFHF